MFRELKDQRTGGNTLHHFGEIIFISFAAIVSGMKSYEMIEEFGDINKEWFRKWLKLPNGIPSYNTFARVIEALDPKVFSQCIATHLQLVLDNETLEGISQIAIDGKAMRGSATEGETHLHAVSAWGCGLGAWVWQIPILTSYRSSSISLINPYTERVRCTHLNELPKLH